MKTPKKHAPPTQSATSLPLAPEDDAGARVRTYLITMGIRTACLVLMALVIPYGWHTILFAIGAVVLPYFAVVVANAASGKPVVVAQRPEAPAIEAPATRPERDGDAAAPVIRISEAPRREDPGPR
ncbi:DUF3099 domain-containing protein [Microbacterium album]|uniref:DUF3099 domain-containing protein n=1 Tax=Microbacterium album TaxID=2053191 RepID=A0A917ICN7_9MICO|nr:DUF3099 domain-containing protein [Microbacterium album]GGH35039.1 hypothetical protein GCM10010921_03180 [Microbacterium album]